MPSKRNIELYGETAERPKSSRDYSDRRRFSGIFDHVPSVSERETLCVKCPIEYSKDRLNHNLRVVLVFEI